jgi:hypothetical protein
MQNHLIGDKSATNLFGNSRKEPYAPIMIASPYEVVTNNGQDHQTYR